MQGSKDTILFLGEVLPLSYAAVKMVLCGRKRWTLNANAWIISGSIAATVANPPYTESQQYYQEITATISFFCSAAALHDAFLLTSIYYDALVLKRNACNLRRLGYSEVESSLPPKKKMLTFRDKRIWSHGHNIIYMANKKNVFYILCTIIDVIYYFHNTCRTLKAEMALFKCNCLRYIFSRQGRPLLHAYHPQSTRWVQVHLICINPWNRGEQSM